MTRGLLHHRDQQMSSLIKIALNRCNKTVMRWVVGLPWLRLTDHSQHSKSLLLMSGLCRGFQTPVAGRCEWLADRCTWKFSCLPQPQPLSHQTQLPHCCCYTRLELAFSYFATSANLVVPAPQPCCTFFAIIPEASFINAASVRLRFKHWVLLLTNLII